MSSFEDSERKLSLVSEANENIYCDSGKISGAITPLHHLVGSHPKDSLNPVLYKFGMGDLDKILMHGASQINS